MSPQLNQEDYSYPGCEEHTIYCPQDGTFLCAARTIEAKYGACSTDSDCVLVNPGSSCYSYGECPPAAVRADSVQAFRTEVRVEIDRYCASPTCRSAASCGLDLSAVRAICESGRCRSTLPVLGEDAGE